MSEVGTACAWLLAAVLAWAGAAKLGSIGATTASFRAMQLPAPEALAVIVPVLEIAVAVGLLVAPGLAAVGAVVLLSAFTALLVRLVSGPDAVPCGCFGGTSHDEAGPADVVRNLGLLLAALGALWGHAAVPTLPATITVTAAASIVLMAMGLVRLRDELGVVWDNTLPGEAQHA